MGMHPSGFWELTHAEFMTMYRGFVRARRRQVNDMLYTAWHVAALSRQQTLPEMKALLIDEEPSANQRELTVDEQIDMLRVWTAALGGTVVEV